MNLINALSNDRFGPDIIWTHWMLYFSFLGKFLAKKKFGHIGRNSSVRPYVTIVGGKNIFLADNITIRSFSQLHAGKQATITIEDDVLMAPGVFMTTNNHRFSDIEIPIRKQGGTQKNIRIKQGAWIAANAVILQGVTVGKNSVVAAGAIVNKDVPDYCVVAGVPAKIIKKLAK
ncbi:MAG: acyltransferase [Prolixibacteraceae bacterium]